MNYAHTDSRSDCCELNDEAPRLSLGCGLLMALVIAVFRLASPTHLNALRAKKLVGRTE